MEESNSVGHDRGIRRRLCICWRALPLWNRHCMDIVSSSSPALSPRAEMRRGPKWMVLVSLSSMDLIRRGSAALYLPSSGLMACGLMGPVRMGLAVEMGGFSESVRSTPIWWLGVEGSCDGFPPWSRRGTLLTCDAFSCCCCCCCSEKNLWVDWSTSARCLA